MWLHMLAMYMATRLAHDLQSTCILAVIILTYVAYPDDWRDKSMLLPRLRPYHMRAHHL